MIRPPPTGYYKDLAPNVDISVGFGVGARIASLLTANAYLCMLNSLARGEPLENQSVLLQHLQ